MDVKVQSLTQHLKAHDRDLFASRASNGMVQVFRKSVRWESFKFSDTAFHYLRPNPQLVLCLTDTWNGKGKPIEWGIEPVLEQIKSMDAWARNIYSEIVEKRDRDEALKLREFRNNNRAIAADMRRDFAKATNDINTSSLKKTDVRRRKDGISQSG